MQTLLVSRTAHHSPSFDHTSGPTLNMLHKLGQLNQTGGRFLQSTIRAKIKETKADLIGE